jgi:hypothetical protein
MTHVIKIVNYNLDVDALKRKADDFNVDPVGVVNHSSNVFDTLSRYPIWISHFLLEFKTQEEAMKFKLKYQGLCEYYKK